MPRSRSRSRDSERSGGRPRRTLRAKKSNFSSTLDEGAPITQQLSSAEILSQYKALNPAASSLVSQNKSERQLYIGNIP